MNRDIVERLYDSFEYHTKMNLFIYSGVISYLKQFRYDDIDIVYDSYPMLNGISKDSQSLLLNFNEAIEGNRIEINLVTGSVTIISNGRHTYLTLITVRQFEKLVELKSLADTILGGTISTMKVPK